MRNVKNLEANIDENLLFLYISGVWTLQNKKKQKEDWQVK